MRKGKIISLSKDCKTKSDIVEAHTVADEGKSVWKQNRHIGRFYLTAQCLSQLV